MGCSITVSNTAKPLIAKGRRISHTGSMIAGWDRCRIIVLLINVPRYTIGRNIALDVLRRKARQTVLSPEEMAQCRAETYDLERAYLTEERKVTLHHALDTLHPEYRQILWLIYFEEMSSSEAAIALGKSSRQTANLLYRAKAALRSQLEKEGFVYEEL